MAQPIDLNFLMGSSINLSKLSHSLGDFIVTTDNGRMYLGQENNKLLPLNAFVTIAEGDPGSQSNLYTEQDKIWINSSTKEVFFRQDSEWQPIKAGSDSEVVYISSEEEYNSLKDYGNIQEGTIYLVEGKSNSSFGVTSVNGKIGPVVLTATDVSAVPNTRTINGKSLSNNITLTASDVSAVSVNRTINGKTLTSDINLTAENLGAVPSSRTVNYKSLSNNVILTASDVKARPDTWIPSLNELGAAPAYQYSKTDLTPGSSPLAEGMLYIVYE